MSGLMGVPDGNTIAGTLFDVFGVDMTDANGICASCATASLLGELKVSLDGRERSLAAAVTATTS